MKTHREIKSDLFEQVARVAKAVASPKRLELIELLCQAPKTVETLAHETGMSVKLVSAHLKELRTTNLVSTERQGKNISYRLASTEVARFWVLMRSLAEDRSSELRERLNDLSLSGAEWSGESHEQIMRKAKAGEVLIIDVRPKTEYAYAHLPYALCLPLADLPLRLTELPKDKQIIAYCRGPYCSMSLDAVQLLQENGYAALIMRDGVAEWDQVALG
jgi:rhodanese-related sulfurtransferase